MPAIRDTVDRLLDRRREARDLAALEAEIARLRAQNDRLRAAMRRCVTCDYRLNAAASAPLVAATDLDGDPSGPPISEGAEP